MIILKNYIIKNKLITKYNIPILYFINYKKKLLLLNKYLNKKFIIIFKKYYCLLCKNNIKIFNNGYCKKCYFNNKNYYNIYYYKPHLYKNSIINNKNIKKIFFKKHIIYLSYTSNFKIGITFKKKILIRLIDQGAIFFLKLAKTPNRIIAGIIENKCKNLISDTTNFRKMLINNNYNNDLINQLINIKNNIIYYIINNYKKYKKYILYNNKIFNLYFPIIKYYKNKIINIKIDKIKILYNTLKGIKGQYLIFNNNIVFNIRNHIGYIIDIYII
ncbi:MAG: hypothetical protein RDO_1320 [Flavobacteriales endosymbiont of Rhyzopertha dominica]